MYIKSYNTIQLKTNIANKMGQLCKYLLDNILF